MKGLVAVASVLLAACSASAPITEEWFAGRWQSTEGEFTSITEANGSTLWLYVGGAESAADLLIIEQYRVVSDTEGPCMTLRTNGDQRVMRMRFREAVPASAEIMAATRGQLAPTPDREYRACRDGETLRLGTLSGDGELELVRYSRVEATGALPLTPPRRSDLENTCGLSCNPQSSNFNACFMSCRQVVERLPPLDVGADRSEAELRPNDTRVIVPAGSVKVVEFRGQTFEVDISGAMSALSRYCESGCSGASRGDLLYPLLRRGLPTEAEVNALWLIDVTSRNDGHQSFFTPVQPDPATPTETGAPTGHADETNAHSPEADIVPEGYQPSVREPPPPAATSAMLMPEEQNASQMTLSCRAANGIEVIVAVDLANSTLIWGNDRRVPASITENWIRWDVERDRFGRTVGSINRSTGTIETRTSGEITTGICALVAGKPF